MYRLCGTPDHQVTKEGAADERVAGVVDVGGAEPEAAGGSEGRREVVWCVNGKVVVRVGEEGEGEGVVDESVLDCCAVGDEGMLVVLRFLCEKTMGWEKGRIYSSTMICPVSGSVSSMASGPG